MHAYFLIGGDPKVPIIYEVDRIRDGKSFTTRRVVAIQHGQAIFTLMVSFHNDEPGLDPSSADAAGAAARGSAERGPDPRDRAADDARSGAALLPERTANRTASGRISAATSARSPRTANSTSGSARPAICPTIRRSISACSPMRPTCRCSTRRWRRMGAACSRRSSWARASTMRSGCTGRSAPTTGCSTHRRARS